MLVRFDALLQLASECRCAIASRARANAGLEYYVAGRRILAIYNGMATGADWMSAGSFIGMAGTLYLTGYGASPSSWAGQEVIVWWPCCWHPTAQVRPVHHPRFPGRWLVNWCKSARRKFVFIVLRTPAAYTAGDFAGVAIMVSAGM